MGGFVLCTIFGVKHANICYSCCNESSPTEFGNLRQWLVFHIGIITILQTHRINTRDGFFCNVQYHTGQKPVFTCFQGGLGFFRGSHRILMQCLKWICLGGIIIGSDIMMGRGRWGRNSSGMQNDSVCLACRVNPPMSSLDMVLPPRCVMRLASPDMMGKKSCQSMS